MATMGNESKDTFTKEDSDKLKKFLSERSDEALILHKFLKSNLEVLDEPISSFGDVDTASSDTIARKVASRIEAIKVISHIFMQIDISISESLKNKIEASKRSYK